MNVAVTVGSKMVIGFLALGMVAVHCSVSDMTPAAFERPRIVKVHTARGSISTFSGVIAKIVFCSAGPSSFSPGFLARGGGTLVLAHVSVCGLRPRFSSVTSIWQSRFE